MQQYLIYLVFLSNSFFLCNGVCRTVYDNKVTNADKSLIVDLHNKLRKQIANGEVRGQPRGVNLKRMKYDEKLAREAQKISNTCVFEHVRVNDKRWHAVGQNLYLEMSSAFQRGANWTAGIIDWFNEHQYYRFGSGFSPSTGHYTQLVWADTEYVGCGYTFYKSGGVTPYQKLYTCNYGPAGNYIGQNPYKVGTRGCENLC